MTKRKNQAASDIKQGIVINQLCSFLLVSNYDGYNALCPNQNIFTHFILKLTLELYYNVL